LEEPSPSEGFVDPRDEELRYDKTSEETDETETCTFCECVDDEVGCRGEKQGKDEDEKSSCEQTPGRCFDFYNIPGFVFSSFQLEFEFSGTLSCAAAVGVHTAGFAPSLGFQLNDALSPFNTDNFPKFFHREVLLYSSPKQPLKHLLFSVQRYRAETPGSKTLTE